MDYYERIIPRIAYYIKSKNITRIFKEKCAILAAGEKDIINLFSNSLELMGYFWGSKCRIHCLCTISNIILASGSEGGTIQLWNCEERSIISTLSTHTETISALCSINIGQLASGSKDKSLIIWSKHGSSTYSHIQILKTHTSTIEGIIRLNNREIVSGEAKGDLRVWDTDQGVCIRHIPPASGFVFRIQMKQHIGGDVVVSYWNRVIVWGGANNWGSASYKQFINVCGGYAIEFLGDFLLRGGDDGQLEFVDYVRGGCWLPSAIQNLHSYAITDILRIAKNIVITVSGDGFLKVIDPICRKLYFSLFKSEGFKGLAYFY